MLERLIYKFLSKKVRNLYYTTAAGSTVEKRSEKNLETVHVYLSSICVYIHAY